MSAAIWWRFLGLSHPAPSQPVQSVSANVVPRPTLPSVSRAVRPDPGLGEPTPPPPVEWLITPQQRVAAAIAHIDALLVTVPRPAPDDDQGALSTHAALCDVRVILTGGDGG